jgi:predicted GH43/DUF377 family glycosyl hydrolase
MHTLGMSVLCPVFVALLAMTGSISAQTSPTLTVTSINPNPVLSQGSSGAWDSVDVMNPSGFYTQGVMANYYSGRNGSVWQTGVAVSTDGGQSWQKETSPIITVGAGGWATQYIAANGSTLAFNNQIMTFYEGETSSGAGQIGLSTAVPTSQLTQTQYPTPVLPNGSGSDGDARHAADPFVMQVNNYLLMYYLGVPQNWQFCIMQAISFDGIHWVKNKTPVMTMNPNDPNEAGGIGEPDVFQYGGTWLMIYVGNTTGNYRSLMWASSPDGARGPSME